MPRVAQRATPRASRLGPQSTKLCVYEERVSLLAAETKHLPEELAATGEAPLLLRDGAVWAGAESRAIVMPSYWNWLAVQALACQQGRWGKRA